VASWYGHPFHGRTTASGETYDMEAMTAAHRTLPFGTVVQVDNLDNGQRTRVRINDRGPFVRGRIIDLSRRAARELDMVGAGIARVRITILEAP
jgi:rare lipoprotein A